MAMYTLNTYMDGDGFAYPSTRLWAEMARMARGTLVKHIATAVAGGWLSVGVRDGKSGKGWRQNTYRCTVPLQFKLSGKDENIADGVASTYGEVDDGGGSTIREPAKGEHGGSTIGEPANVLEPAIERGACAAHGGSNHTPMVVQTDADGGSKSGISDQHGGSTHIEPEVLTQRSSKKKYSEEGAARPLRTVADGGSKDEGKAPESANLQRSELHSRHRRKLRDPEPKAVRLDKAAKQRAADPTFPFDKLAQIYDVPESEIMQRMLN